MRVALINPTGGGISGGYKNYLTNILPLIAADGRVESLLCVSPASLRVPEWLPRIKNLQFADCPPFRIFDLSLGRELHRILSSFDPDVILVPTARVVRFRDVPVITMIQNMAPLVGWEWYGLPEKPRLAAQWLETRRAVRQADAVIAISDFVRQFLVNKWRVSPGKVSYICFGAPLPASAPVRPAPIPAECGNFIFTAGSIEPYRGLEDLINCAEYLRTSQKHPLKVVIAGSARGTMKSYERHLKTMSERAGVSADLCWIGQLTKEEMTWCYGNCLAFAMTSRVEAAPNTVLEAMACGAVSIAADNAPLPEFFAETALYYKPGDSKALAARINEVACWDTVKRDKNSSAARKLSGKFNWGTAAKRTLDLLESLSRPS